MSAQTTDRQVNQANEKFFQIVKSPQDAINLWVDKIQQYISSIGFYKNKAKFIYETSFIIQNKYNWEIPQTIQELKSLPWVWIKTAKVVTSILFQAPYLAVDTHVHRVLNRIWIVHTSKPEQTDKEMEKILDTEATVKLHHNLIFFGRYHCTARKSKCQTCPVSQICEYYKQSF
jgi:endonuclease III